METNVSDNCLWASKSLDWQVKPNSRKSGSTVQMIFCSGPFSATGPKRSISMTVCFYTSSEKPPFGLISWEFPDCVQANDCF